MNTDYMRNRFHDDYEKPSKAQLKGPANILNDKGFIVVNEGVGTALLKNGHFGSVFDPTVKVYRCTWAEYEKVNGPLEPNLVWTPWSTTTTTITTVG